MSRDVVTSAPEDLLSTVIARMSAHSLHEMPVVDRQGRLVGYFSFDGLLRKKHVPITTKIGKLMVAPPRIEGDRSIFEAAQVMLETGFRALPVMDDDGTLTGIISRTDVIGAAAKLHGTGDVKAGDVMSEEPEVLSERDSIGRAVELMLGLGEVAAPVVDRHGRIAGSVLIEDISRAVWFKRESGAEGDLEGEKDRMEVEVGAFISEAAVVKREDPLKDVCEAMIRVNPYMSVVADRAGRPLGVITQYDVLKRLIGLEQGREMSVDVTGLERDDPFTRTTLYSKIERFMEKMGRFNWIRAESLSLHVENQMKGGRRRWGIRARLRTNKGLFHVTAEDWDLLSCADEIVEGLNKRVISLKR